MRPSLGKSIHKYSKSIKNSSKLLSVKYSTTIDHSKANLGSTSETNQQSDKNIRFNQFGIQLLPPQLHESVFPPTTLSSASKSSSVKVFKVAYDHLKRHNIPYDKSQPILKPPTSLSSKMCELFGNNLAEHIKVIGMYGESPYRELIDSFDSELAEMIDGNNGSWDIEKPKVWCTNSGWTKYEWNGSKWKTKPVPYPDAKVIVFDVETGPNLKGECIVGSSASVDCASFAATSTKHSAYPLMAIARSSKYWYSWTAPTLNNPQSNPFDVSLGPRLISLGSPEVDENCPLVVIGHSVSFDRARVLEEYSASVCWPDHQWTNTKPRRKYLDTLSLHCSIAGLSTQQRPEWTRQTKKEDNVFDQQLDPTFEISNNFDGTNQKAINTSVHDRNSSSWINKGAMNNLVDAVKLHCNPKDPLLQTFIEHKNTDLDLLLKAEHLNDIQQHKDEIMSYCARDVLAAMALFRNTWIKWSKQMCPHPITLSAILEMGSSMALTVQSPGWPDFIVSCEKGYQQANEQMEAKLKDLVIEMATIPQDEANKDLWLRHLDWTPIPSRYTKPKYKKNGDYAIGGEPRPIGDSHLFGKPTWYRQLYSKKQLDVSAKLRILPYLLRLTWNDRPVKWIEKSGWCYEKLSINEVGEEQHDSSEPNKLFLRIPHPEREGSNVGGLLSKAFLPMIESGIIKAVNKESQQLLQYLAEFNTLWSFWTSYRDRITHQMVIWQGEPGTTIPETNPRIGVILPCIITTGTVSRRAVEPTWMTASNSKPKLAGSELKSKIIAPPSSTSLPFTQRIDINKPLPEYVFVGADVDSQEIWIAGLFGDSQFHECGATALSWMTLQGTKAEGTDLHSRTASILGMSRDAAKIFNYGRVYGAGVKYAAELLRKFNPKLSIEEATQKAQALYAATKGKRLYTNHNSPTNTCKDQFVQYSGGTESYMFNSIEALAKAQNTVTPCLQACISEALKSTNVKSEFLTSRVNWVVQSSGVDYLHLLVSIMSVMTRLYCTPARLLLTIHDEARYLVPGKYAYRAALLLQIANFWTRAFFAYQAGIENVPLGVAFFSAIDIDTVLRKDPTHPCQTITFPTKIPPGLILDIHQLLEKLKEQNELDFQKDFIIEKQLKELSVKVGELPKDVPVLEVPEDEQEWIRRLQLQSNPDYSSLLTNSKSGLNTKKTLKHQHSSTKESMTNKKHLMTLNDDFTGLSPAKPTLQISDPFPSQTTTVNKRKGK